MTVEFILNGEDVSCRVRATDRLSEVLREEFSLSGVGSDCLAGRCGRCVILMNGRLVLSCLVPAFKARGAEIVSAEGFAKTDEASDVAVGFEAAKIDRCAFCGPQRRLIAGAILDEGSRASDQRILEAMQTVHCRCTEPESLVKAVRAAAEAREQRTWRRAR